MLTVDLKVNGSLIGGLEILNRGPIDGEDPGDPNGAREYSWSYGRTLQDGRFKVYNGTTVHQRVNGAELLASTVLQSIYLRVAGEQVVGQRTPDEKVPNGLLS